MIAKPLLALLLAYLS
jgi:hypothetical protein